MLDFFDMIAEYLQWCVSFFVTMIQGIITAFTTLLASVQNLVYMTGFTPYFISASIFISLFVVIVNYIIGRSNQ